MTSPIGDWLAGVGLPQYADAFVAADIDVDLLPDLTEADYERLGVSIGHRKRIARRLLAERQTAGQRRQLTVLFCDIVDSTALAAQLDPEDMRSTISAYHAMCARIVASYDGTVSQFLGDGIMAGFGYPRAHEDDAERAVRCALSMIEGIAALDLPQRVRLQTRIGITTGTEVVGDLPDATRDRASVVGATPSFAARLQTLAEPGTVVIGATTRRLLGDTFAFTALGRRTVKGFAEPIDLWRVDAATSGVTRFAARRRTSVPLVGREAEATLLADRWRLANRGEGQAVLLIAEAGVGKSRLVESAVSAATGAMTLRLQCSPLFQGSALYPVLAAIEHAARVGFADGPAERREKLAAFAKKLPKACNDDAVALLFALPGAEESPRARALSVEQRRALIFRELLEQFAALAQTQPLLLVVEDVQWIDPTTLELLTQMVASVQLQPVLLIATARPEFESPWMHHGHVTTLTLDRLSRSAVEQLIEHVCARVALPESLLRRIVERTDGVPLFVEELTKTILESGPLDGVAALAIPDTLRDALAARLDALGHTREIAQIAAVIGREFPADLLAAVSGLDTVTLYDGLERLVESDLVVRSDAQSDKAFAFRHALVRDAAYDGLLRSRRLQLHLRTARAMVDQFRAMADDVPEIVAQHFEEGGATNEALRYWHEAAKRAMARSAYREATAQLRHALVLIERTDDAGGAIELDLLNRLGLALIVLEGETSAEAVWARAWEIAAGLPESRATFSAQWGICLCDVLSGRTSAAREHANAMIATAERLGEDALMLEALHAGWAVAFITGDLATVIDSTKRGVPIYDRDRHHAHVTTFGTGHDSGVCAWGHGAIALITAGRFDEGRRYVAELSALADAIDHPFSKCHGLRWLVQAYDLLGEPDRTVPYTTRCVELARANNFGLFAEAAQGIGAATVLDCGDRSAGVAVLRRVLDAPSCALPASWTPVYMARLALAELADGDEVPARRRLEAAVSMARQLGGCFGEPEVYRIQGVFHHRLGAAWPTVRDFLDSARSTAKVQQAVLYELRALIDILTLTPPEHDGDRDDARRALESLLAKTSGAEDIAEVRRARRLV